MPPAPSSSTALNAILPLIQSGDAYSAHQKARTFASRYLKAKQYPVTIDVLFQSAKELFKAGQPGSATDLAVFLVDAYDTAGEPLTDESRGRLTQLIALAGSEGVWRDTLVGKAIAWSIKASGCPAGDPELHHYIGELLYKEHAFPQAEHHYLASGTRDSAKQLAQLMFEWSKGSADPGSYATRGVIPYLLTTNVLAARVFLSTFLSLLIPSQPTILAQLDPVAISLSSSSSDEIYATTNHTLNFLQLAIRLCQRAEPNSSVNEKASRDARNAWVRLCGRYVGGVGGSVQGGRMLVAGEGNMKEAVAAISHIYFNIQPPRGPGNPLQDMMASFFGGGGAGDTPASAPKLAIGRGRGRGTGSKSEMALD